MLNPDTSSDSPSAKSKGVRLVSAKADTNHKIEIGSVNRIRKFSNPGSFINLKEVLRDTKLKIIIASLTS